MVQWAIRVVVLVAWAAFILTLVPGVSGLSDYINSLPDFVVYWLGYFLVASCMTIIVAGDVARFVIRRFNP